MEKRIQFVTFKEDNLLEIISSNCSQLIDWANDTPDIGDTLLYSDEFYEWLLAEPKYIDFSKTSNTLTTQIIKAFFDYLELGTKTKIKRKYSRGIYWNNFASALKILEQEGDQRSIQLWKFLCSGRSFKHADKVHTMQLENETVYGYLTGDEVNYLLKSLLNLVNPPNAIEFIIEYFNEIKYQHNFVYYYIS